MKKLSLIGVLVLLGCDSEQEQMELVHAPLKSTSFDYGNPGLESDDVNDVMFLYKIDNKEKNNARLSS